MREFHSPYVSVGNNPTNLIDPTGGTSKHAGGYKNPDNFWKRTLNWITGHQFLNDAYAFKQAHPDIEINYQYDVSGNIIGAGAIFTMEFSGVDKSGCSVDCGVIQQELSFGKFDWGLMAPCSLPVFQTIVNLNKIVVCRRC